MLDAIARKIRVKDTSWFSYYLNEETKTESINFHLSALVGSFVWCENLPDFSLTFDELRKFSTHSTTKSGEAKVCEVDEFVHNLPLLFSELLKHYMANDSYCSSLLKSPLADDYSDHFILTARDSDEESDEEEGTMFMEKELCLVRIQVDVNQIMINQELLREDKERKNALHIAGIEEQKAQQRGRKVIAFKGSNYKGENISVAEETQQFLNSEGYGEFKTARGKRLRLEQSKVQFSNNRGKRVRKGLDDFNESPSEPGSNDDVEDKDDKSAEFDEDDEEDYDSTNGDEDIKYI